MCPNGHKSSRELIRHCKASCVIAKLDNGNFLLEKQYRYPYDEVILEFPAGKCDKDEDPNIIPEFINIRNMKDPNTNKLVPCIDIELV